jgi:hypothetical protein
MRALIVVAVLLCVTANAAAQYAGSPPRLALPTPSACQLRLAKFAQFQHLPSLAAPGGCGAIDPVLLQSVILGDGEAKVAVVPPATLRCMMAEAVATWIREDVAPAALRLGAPLRGLDNADSYDCRSRNRIAGAMLSEHGRANALDVSGFKLADGRRIKPTDVNVAKDWREALRASACARFSTVLGPGSDGYHEQHIHLDLAQRRSGYRTCDWDVRGSVAPLQLTGPGSSEAAAATAEPPVPLPRPRPTPRAVGADGRGSNEERPQH